MSGILILSYKLKEITNSYVLHCLGTSRIAHTEKPLNFARDLISLRLQVLKIREIKYPRMFKFYIDSNSKASRFAKLSTCKDGSNLQFAKLSPHEIKVFYSNSATRCPIEMGFESKCSILYW